MSSSPYAGRHRPTHRTPVRVPRTLTGGFVLPTTAAVTLILTATGASVAESNTLAPLTLTGVQAMDLSSQEAEAQADTEQVAQRRVESQGQAAALVARQQEASRARAARAKQRAELAQKAAAAKAKAESKASADAAAAKAKAKAEAKARADAAAVKAKAEAAAANANAEAAAAAADAHRWIMPLTSWTFTSSFRMRWGAMHEGNDLAVPNGTPIMAMSSGQVIFTGWMGGGGNTTKIRYWDGTVSYFEHQSYIKTRVGANVAPGDVVGLVGNTGHSFGAHLHLEIHPNGQDAVDPTPWLHRHNLFLKD